MSRSDRCQQKNYITMLDYPFAYVPQALSMPPLGYILPYHGTSPIHDGHVPAYSGNSKII